MSYNRQSQNQTQFKESLTYEEIIKRQIVKCGEALSENNVDAAAGAVGTLIDYVTPKMMDETYLAKMQELEDRSETEFAARMKAYRKKLRQIEGGCPDLLDKPTNAPNLQFWKDVFAVCLGVFERKGLLMKFSVEDSL